MEALLYFQDSMVTYSEGCYKACIYYRRVTVGKGYYKSIRATTISLQGLLGLRTLGPEGSNLER